ncbi:MAG: thioredoxin domain-containing protein [Acidimicrobiia bacterium]|nr:thioredoxin domain-containing protein [Acidimicrobiia bacterium]
MPNRLASETSPYLRQHADNPVDWWPWCEEAWDLARRRDVPVLVSVGYSSCHWCHVMAHESFEDPAIGLAVNEAFVAIKVDREERPDVDAVYMEAVQATTGRGGWPMTVFCTPDGRPFLAGTYFPRYGRGGMVGFGELCERVADLWRTRRDDLEEQASEITAALGATATLDPADGLPGSDLLQRAVAAALDAHDDRHGGFGTAPKFPHAMMLDLLLRHHVRTGDEAALTAALRTLDAMAAGGMADQLDGGFARYSTDDTCSVPHFEKMLTDQALLARVYLHAWQVTGAPRYRRVLESTIGYVLDVLAQPGGGFASAEDADSDDGSGTPVEGAYYVWTAAELRAALAEAGLADDEIERAAAWWSVEPLGTFEGDASVLQLSGGLTDEEPPPTVERATAALAAARRRRPRPGLDDKVLTEWNALFVATLAEAAGACERSDWADAAVGCAEFLRDTLRRDDGRWLRSWQGDDPDSGQARHLATAADLAAVVAAFVRITELTGDGRWLVDATDTATQLVELFWDDERGGLYSTGSDAEPLVVRPKDLVDNATPSANSLAAEGLIRLSVLTGDTTWDDRARRIVRLAAPLAERQPLAFGHLLAAVDLLTGKRQEVVVSGRRTDLVGVVRSRYRPGTVLAWGEPWDGPLWDGRRDPNGSGRAYVCEGYVCAAPSSDPSSLVAALGDEESG